MLRRPDCVTLGAVRSQLARPRTGFSSAVWCPCAARHRRRRSPRSSTSMREKTERQVRARGARNAAPPRVTAPLESELRARKLHKRLHTHCTFDEEQVALNEKAPMCGAFAEPSDGPEPSTSVVGFASSGWVG